MKKNSFFKNETTTAQTTVEQATNHQEIFFICERKTPQKVVCQNIEINLTQKQMQQP